MICVIRSRFFVSEDKAMRTAPERYGTHLKIHATNSFYNNGVTKVP